MKWVMRMLTFLIVLVLALMAYVRFAPTDAARWHVTPQITQDDVTEAGGFRAIRQTNAPDDVILEILYDNARTTPRTQLIAGSVAEGMMTFETRSARMGFPDYTTITIQDGVLLVYGRLRFGQADLGVNKARVQGWLAAVAPLTSAL